MNRCRMQKTVAKICFNLGLGLTIILCAGCIVPSQQAVRSGPPQENMAAPASTPPARPQGLIKPTIPREGRQRDPDAPPLPPVDPEENARPGFTERVEPEMSTASGNQVQEETEPVPPVAAPQPPGPTPHNHQTKPARHVEVQPTHPPKMIAQNAGSSQSREKKESDEDQKIKDAALDVAKNFAQVTKIKVCYSVKDDEWWITLYDKAGSFTELKQYTWNRDQEKLEVFLVVKRIPSNRVEQQLNEEEPGRACEVLSVPSQPGRQ